MEKRRIALRLVLAGSLIAAAPAWACTPALKGTTLESERYVLAFQVSEVSVGKHFSIEVSSCSKNNGAEPESLKVDAHMPEHRHGMNYVPSVTKLGPGRWRAEGLMLHMPGKWEFVFELRASGKTDRLASNFLLSQSINFSEEEKKRILSHGPWPPKLERDPSNRVSGRIEAAALGERLFFEPRLSGTGSVLCATCHVPFRGFQDARPRGVGLEEVDRNTPSVLDVRFSRWFGWDGANDSLWAQSLRPLLDPREMRSSAARVAGFIRTDPFFSKGYQRVFEKNPLSVEDETILVDVGKALAAYQETLVSARTPFDDFRDALEKNDAEGMARYPAAAQRGLKIFVGKGNCGVCHFGPRFTNGEFADTGVPFFRGKGAVDSGRHEGIKKLKDNSFNLLGRYSDDPARSSATSTRHVEPQHRNFGEFRVPGLRNVARTAPYMHNGSIATLREVVSFYSELNEERLHADGERILKPLELSEAELADLVAFLESLTSTEHAVAAGRQH
jgi:cytochrome c peroxidase